MDAVRQAQMTLASNHIAVESGYEDGGDDDVITEPRSYHHQIQRILMLFFNLLSIILREERGKLPN